MVGFSGSSLLFSVTSGSAVASGPHCALRKSFHFRFFAEPSAWADLYFALHSFMVSAEDGVANANAPSRETDARIVNCLIMIFPPGLQGQSNYQAGQFSCQRDNWRNQYVRFVQGNRRAPLTG